MQAGNFPYGFASGLTIRGMPILQAQPGQVVWVGNSSTLLPGTVAGQDGNAGTYQRPVATLQRAFDMCGSGTGDIIFVKPGHAETIADITTLTPNKAGVAVVGFGQGSSRPTLTYGTLTSAAAPVSAANISFQNFLFVANLAAIVSPFTTAAAKDFCLERCEFRDGTAVNFLNMVKTSTVDNAADGLTIRNCIRTGAGATALTAPLNIGANLDRLIVEDNYFAHALAANSGLILQPTTTKVLSNVRIMRNTCNFVGANAATGVLLITTATTHDGVFGFNTVYSARAVATALLVTASSGFKFVENYYQAVADLSGILLPANA